MSPSTDQREYREFASELKFLVTRPVAEQIREWARARLSPDPHVSEGLGDAYQIASLYFDTESYDVFHRKGSYARSKYRIRRYGPSEVAFLERKLKTRGIVSKRRSIIKIEDLERLSRIEPERSWAGFWYHQRLLVRRLRPICEIAYRRTARVSMTERGPIRLTLDENVQAWPLNGLIFNGAKNGKLLSESLVILELKFRAEMPDLFKQLVEGFSLRPQPISKYRFAAVALGFVAEPVPQTPTESPAATAAQLLA